MITNDSSVFTRASLDAIQHDVLLSVLVVAGVLLLFLHAWRHTVIVLLAIPTSLISTFLVMYALGFSLNIMSMMALALMIGILVDDSIVVLENIHRHLQLGESPFIGGAHWPRRDRPGRDRDHAVRRRRLHADRLHQRHASASCSASTA